MHVEALEFVCMRVCRLPTPALAMAARPGLVALACPGRATTLEQLTLDDMIQKSTAIVRARVTGSHARIAARPTSTRTSSSRCSKPGSRRASELTEVAVPGGVANGIRQSVAGAPELKPGQEYVLFLWTSRSGLTQVIGLSQGLFKLSEEGSEGGSVAVAQRPAASELMLDRSGLPVEDRAVSMPVQDLRARVLQALGAAK